MANTYTQIFIHMVFAVKFRRAQIPASRCEEVYKYMAGVINKIDKCKAIKIGGVPDHVHVLFRMSAKADVSQIAKDVKVATNKYINDNEIVEYHNFSWQEGYGAFSVSATHTDALVNYIDNQAQHHLTGKFLDEYRELLVKNKVDFDDQYIFKELE